MFYVILEYAEHGNLRDFLKMQRPVSDGMEATGGYERSLTPQIPENEAITPLTTKDLVSFSFQVSRGMEFLSCKKVKLHFHCVNTSYLTDDSYCPAPAGPAKRQKKTS